VEVAAVLPLLVVTQHLRMEGTEALEQLHLLLARLLLMQEAEAEALPQLLRQRAAVELAVVVLVVKLSPGLLALQTLEAAEAVRD
jgi:hypothetical protein